MFFKKGNTASEITRNIQNILAGTEGATVEALYNVALDIAQRSVEKAPVKTGALRGSAYVTTDGVKRASGKTNKYKNVGIYKFKRQPNFAKLGKRTEITVGFSSVYAWYQHENLHFKHPKGGQAKYLESTIEENADKYHQMLINSAKDSTP